MQRYQSRLERDESNMESLTRLLHTLDIEELEEGSSSEARLEIGDHVIATTNPHLGRIGTVVYAGNYWTRVICDADKDIFKKAKHNLRLTGKRRHDRHQARNRLVIGNCTHKETNKAPQCKVEEAKET